MGEILMGRATEAGMDAEALLGMYRLRYTTFFEKLGWDVESINDMEIDHFDQRDPVYMVARDEEQQVNGCWRLLPTTGPYMLKNTFPELLRGESAPSDPRVWELSRFAVAASTDSDRRQVNFSDVTFRMMRHVFEFARHNNIDQYVTVTSVSLERMLRRIGIPLCRFGDGRAQKIGKVLSVACRIDVDEQSRRAVYQLAAGQTSREAA